MKQQEDFRQPQDLYCGWISPEGNIHVFLPKESEQIADALCRELLEQESVPLPGDYLLDSGWVRVRKKQVEFRQWPTDRQYDRLHEYGLTTSTPQDRCMFEIPNTKRVRDPFFRKDNYKGESWYNQFNTFLCIGVCLVPHDEVFAVREALARFGFDTYTVDGDTEKPGKTWIMPGNKKQIELRRKISAALPEGNSYQFSIVSVEVGGHSIDDIVVGGYVGGEDEFPNYGELFEAAEQLRRDAPDAEQIEVVSHLFAACSGETVDMPENVVQLVIEYGADDFIRLNDVDQVGRFEFSLDAAQFGEEDYNDEDE